MQLQHFHSAISDYDNGVRSIQNGKLRAFLYKRKWYPLRAVVNRAEVIATGLHQDWNVEKCLTELAYIFPYYLRIEDIHFTGAPVSISDSEAIMEIERVKDVLQSFF